MNINDKHIEVIVQQMMRWVKVEDVGDSEFLIDEVVDKFRFIAQNDGLTSGGKKPASGVGSGNFGTGIPEILALSVTP